MLRFQAQPHITLENPSVQILLQIILIYNWQAQLYFDFLAPDEKRAVGKI